MDTYRIWLTNETTERVITKPATSPRDWENVKQYARSAELRGYEVAVWYSWESGGSTRCDLND